MEVALMSHHLDCLGKRTTLVVTIPPLISLGSPQCLLLEETFHCLCREAVVFGLILAATVEKTSITSSSHCCKVIWPQTVCESSSPPFAEPETSSLSFLESVMGSRSCCPV